MRGLSKDAPMKISKKFETKFKGGKKCHFFFLWPKPPNLSGLKFWVVLVLRWNDMKIDKPVTSFNVPIDT